VVDACVVPATGTGERDATILIAGLPRRRVTVGGDKGYGAREFVETLHTLEAAPYIAQTTSSRSPGRHGIWVTRSASALENGSKRSSAG
jgi:hypothetical protein